MKKIISIFFLALAVLFNGCNKPECICNNTDTNDGGTVFENEEESPDFVTFADGKLPAGWKTYTWEIDNTLGYDDNYSLRAANYPALVFANKTMEVLGLVEFYSYGDVDFFIDDVMAQAISSVADGNWKKRTYVLDKGHHKLMWKAEGVYKYIDNIKFCAFE